MDPQTLSLRGCGIGAARAERFKRILKAEDCRFEDPSIKTTDPNAPRGQIVGGHTAPKNNNTYSSAQTQSSAGEPEPKNPPLLNLRYHLH